MEENNNLLLILDELGKNLQTTTSNADKKEILNSLSSIQGGLDSLRLAIRYLIFDLEATRRENETLKKRINKAH